MSRTARVERSTKESSVRGMVNRRHAHSSEGGDSIIRDSQGGIRWFPSSHAKRIVR